MTRWYPSVVAGCGSFLILIIVSTKLENNKITKNSFSGGRNADINVSAIPPDQYISAHNVDFIGSGDFYGLQQIAGTTNVASFGVDASLKEIGSLPCKFAINGVLTYCILYFTMSSKDRKSTRLNSSHT